MLLTLLWLALADSRRLEELVAGMAVGALGATAAVMVRAQRDVVLRPRPRWVLEALRPLGRWPRDLGRSRGRCRHAPTAGSSRSPSRRPARTPADAARRALAVGGGSLAPNAIVVEIDDDRGVLVRHELVGDDA